ncbi:hypothetical protein GCM10010255_41840 [Streptomyces coeruleofuscus]|uniref:Uncharacterized protein n=1 Tax=Streptomyces coeruleofuscus TaxID=66879 RepID=A0ABP5VL16_9ACTN
MLPSISRANAAQGESGRGPAAGEGEGVFAAPTADVFPPFVLSEFDEQAVSMAAVAASPPVSMALRCGVLPVLMWPSLSVPVLPGGSGDPTVVGCRLAPVQR